MGPSASFDTGHAGPPGPAVLVVQGPSGATRPVVFSGLEFWGVRGDMILGMFVGFGGASSDVSPFREGSGSPVRGPVSFLVCYEVMRGGSRAC